MRLAFIGDIHIDDKRPKFRKDDYCLAIIQKLDWILTWCRNNNIDKIILLGDVFERKDVGGRARNLALKVFKKHFKIENAPEVLCTVGNHDTGNDLINFKNTALFTLCQVGYIKILDYDPESMVAFAHHTVDLDRRLVAEGLQHEEALIWSVHGTILTHPTPQYGVNFHDLKIAGPAQLVVCGHIHDYYRAKRADGKRLVNPGHIGRNKFLPNIKEHILQFLVVEHDREKITKYDFIKIECAKPYQDVFDLDKIKLQKHIRKQVKQLITTGDELALESFSIQNIIDLASKLNLENEVLELIAKYLGDAYNNGLG